MDRSRFVRALALTIGVAGTINSLADFVQAGQCDNCDSPTSQRCQCPPGRGLLDTLSDVADKLVKEKPQRKSILHAFKFKVQVSTGCDKTSCGCEPTCGAEPTCGIEPTCGTEASCGVEPNCGIEPSCGAEPTCGAEPSCGIEPSCGAEPSCGIEPKCGVEAGCGIEVRQNYSHATGPIQYPSNVANPSRNGSHPVQTPKRPMRAPEPAIPTPAPEDSTINPFTDDSVSYTRPRVRSASQRISSQASTPVTERSLKFDPQAATRAGQVGPQRAIVRKSVPAPTQRHVSDDAVVEPVKVTVAPLPKPTTVSTRRTNTVETKVVPASASEPAKLPPLKTSHEPFDLSSSRNPLRD